jgi:hypothetical protein
MPNFKKSSDSFDEANAKALMAMLLDPSTAEHVRLRIINDVLESEKSETFFETMIKEGISLGECPHCNHKNHWLIPEDDLNTMNWITFQEDPRVPQTTTSVDCDEYAEACLKKKVTY